MLVVIKSLLIESISGKIDFEPALFFVFKNLPVNPCDFENGVLKKEKWPEEIIQIENRIEITTLNSGEKQRKEYKIMSISPACTEDEKFFKR